MPTDDPELTTKIALLIGGGVIGLVSGLVTTGIAHHLSKLRLERQQARDDKLRKEEREREDKLRKEEREREDHLRQKEMESNRQVFLDQIERENRLRQIDMLWTDRSSLRTAG